MFVLSSEIKIGGKRFTSVNSVEIVKSAKVLEDTATIMLPTTARLERAGRYISEVPTATAFAVGDEVTIALGYDNRLNEEFRGFVRKIRPTTPLSIECEDATFLLRRKTLNKSWKLVTLKEVLTEILRGTGVQLATKYLPAITFHGFYLRDVNGAAALQKLKDDFGLTVYFSAFKTLFVGLSYDSEDKTVIKYDIGTNVIENDLEIQDSSDVQMKVKVIGILPNNERIETEVGDGATPDKYDKVRNAKGKLVKKKAVDANAQFTATDSNTETRTVHFYNVRTKKELEVLGLEELRKFKKTGFKGGLTTFLRPFAKIGNVARVRDQFYPERGDGDYLIEKITTTYGTGGGRRKIELGLKVL